jgi:hypothetical protein
MQHLGTYVRTLLCVPRRAQDLLLILGTVCTSLGRWRNGKVALKGLVVW